MHIVKYRQIDSFVQNDKANYFRIRNKTINRSKTLSEERIREEISFYHSTKDECECGENKLLSAIYENDLPCSHRIFLGATFPFFNPTKLEMRSKWVLLEVETTVLENESDIDASEEFFEKQYALRQIRRYSHYKNNEQIQAYLDEQFRIGNFEKGFLANNPVSLLELIGKGINHFSEIRFQEKSQEPIK